MKTISNLRLTLIFALLCLGSIVAKAVELNSANRDAAYVTTIVQRSEKIVDNLNLNDKQTYDEVTKILANRYFELNDIYSKRDQKIADAKASLEGEAREAAISAAKAEADGTLYRTHFAFPTALSLYLNNEQIDEIKNGMTFNVLNVTYIAQLDMIPSLTDEEKAQLYAWLVEAREFAMDAESAKKKHETFGKYKGRINNYLSKRGYNLTKEREEWAKRVKARGDSL